MVIYADGVMLLNFLVDALLIMGTNRLTGYPVMVGRTASAAALGSLYSGACLLPGFRFLGGICGVSQALRSCPGLRLAGIGEAFEGHCFW